MEIYISEHNGKMVVVLLDDEMKIVKPVYDFLRFQQQKGRAINTLKAYGTDLCLLWTFLKKNGYAYDQVTPRLIADFIDYLRGGDKMLSLYRESNRSNRTINRILSKVHTFYQYQADMHEIDNPILMHEINRPFNMFKGILAHTRSDNKTKQSAPFDALKGLKEAIAAKEKRPEPRRELTDYMKEQINNTLSELRKGQQVTVVYYGSMELETLQVTGTVMKVDAYWQTLQVNKLVIDFSEIYEIIQ